VLNYTSCVQVTVISCTIYDEIRIFKHYYQCIVAKKTISIWELNKKYNQQKSIYGEGSSSTAVEPLLPRAGPLGRPLPCSRPRPFALTPVRLSPSF